MASTRNVLVKLKDSDTSLRCPYTGWCIRRSEQKKTPKVHSQRINDWIKAGALIMLEGAPESVQELLDEPTKGKTVEALKTFAARINEAADEKIIEIKDMRKDDLVEAIENWKNEVAEDD
jgi:hypothetical protein